MSYDDIENATPDIVIGSTIEEPEEDYQVESDNELQAADHESSQINEESAKGKKSVAFTGLDEDEENAEELARKEFEEGGGLPEHLYLPRLSTDKPPLILVPLVMSPTGSLLLSGLSLVSRPFVSRMN